MGERNSATPFLPQFEPPFYLSFTSFQPLFNLILPQFNLCSAGNLEPLFRNHGLQSLGMFSLVVVFSVRIEGSFGLVRLKNALASARKTRDDGDPEFPRKIQKKLKYGEKKTNKEKSHKGIWRSGCPGGVPGTNSGRPRDTWDIWA